MGNRDRRAQLFHFFIFCGVAAAQTPLITTVAGIAAEPTSGFSGDNGPGTLATLSLARLQNECDPLRFEETSHISFDAAGNLYIADASNHRIRRLSPGGIVTTIAGTGERPQTNARCEATSAVGDQGTAQSARLYNPSDAVMLPNGRLIIADQLNNRIRQVAADGTITTIAGNGAHNLYSPGIPATSSPMDWPSAVAADASGIVYFAELHGNRIARIGADGRLATVAGNGFPGYTGDNIAATSAQLNKPCGIAFDATGSLYIADTGNHRIRKVTSDGIIRTIAGTGVAGFSGDDGPADRAALDTPMDVRIDSVGNVYIADARNHRVRVIDTTGTIRTIAGTGTAGRGVDGVDARTSALNLPSALAIDRANDLYIVDWQNFAIRKVSFGSPVLFTGGVVNGASFAAPLAPGSIVAIFGANLSSETTVASGNSWPDQLSGTTIEVTGTAIPLYSTSPGQLTGQLPYNLPSGVSIARAKLNNRTSNAVTLNIAPASPGIFQLSERRAAAINQDGVTINSPSTPERRGNVVSVYITGQGDVAPPVTAGKPAFIDVLSRPLNAATVTVGGVPADLQFIGLTPGSIGLAQANVRIPDNAPTGDAVPVVIRMGDQLSNAATIAIR